MEYEGDSSATVNPLSNITTTAMASTLTADDEALGRSDPSESTSIATSVATTSRDDSARHGDSSRQNASTNATAAAAVAAVGASPLSRASPATSSASAFARNSDANGNSKKYEDEEAEDGAGDGTRSPQEGDSIDAPTLAAAQAREVAAAFEATRLRQSQRRMLQTQASLVRHGEMEDWKQYYRADWTPDRGSDAQARDRVIKNRPSLVETGRAAGASRVNYTAGAVLSWHMWHRDFFLTTIHQNVWKLLGFFSLMYLASFFFFSLLWWLIWKYEKDCLYGIRGYPMVFNFSVVTQQTIGYGNSGPNNCATASVVLVVQTIFGLLLDAITIGVLFARISHPQQRARSIFMSETAVISRRDGILKLMFRIADIKTTQVVEPKVRAYLFTWGDGRHTVEGEFIPVRNEELDLGNIDGLLLLPITIEHTIDERSPLCGHTFESLKALNAEIVVTFEGTTEMGNPFMSRQSYLANEIRWGFQFVRCIHRPHGKDTRYTVNTANFHRIEPQADMPEVTQSKLSEIVVSRSKRAVPYPILGENTLVLSESACLTEENGELALMFRVGDTYPNQILDPIVRVYLYRWPHKPSAKERDYTITELDVGYDTGADRLLLWLPVVVKHTIHPNSPLASWHTMSGFLADADSCIAVVVEGYMYCNSQNRMRMRIYNCFNDIKLHHHFAHMVTRPLDMADRKPRVDWSRFHSTTVDAPGGKATEPLTSAGSARLGRLGSHRPGSRSGARTLKADSMSASRKSQQSDLADHESQTADDASEGQQTLGSMIGQGTFSSLGGQQTFGSGPIRLTDVPPTTIDDGMTGATYEGGALSSLLPHLDEQSTFNRRAGEALSQRSIHRDGPREAYYQGSSNPDLRRSNTMPTSERRRSDTQRAGLPLAWRQLAGTRTGTSSLRGGVGARPSLVPEEPADAADDAF